MPAEIIFSFRPESAINVAEDFHEAVEKLSNRPSSGLCEMKEFMGGGEDPVPIYLNPDRVICVRPY